MEINMQQTSLDAWEGWQGKPSDTLDDLILHALRDVGADGLMCWQIERKISRTHQAVSGNLRHLVERGKAYRIDKRGRTPSGRGAYYWVHADFKPKENLVTAAFQLQHELWV